MSFEVEYFALDATDSSNMYVELNGFPLDSSNVAMDLIGGTAQYQKYTSFAGDFGVDGTKILWDSTSYDLNGLIDTGDKVRVIYDRSST